MDGDFCITDMLVSRKHGSLYSALTQMSLILRAQYEYINADVPRLSDKDTKDTKKVAPERLWTRHCRDDVKMLVFVPDADSDDVRLGPKRRVGVAGPRVTGADEPRG